jgi:hypothetical protein
MTVEYAINDFYNRNGYAEDGGASKKWVKIKFGPFFIFIPNFKSRSENLFLHDANHVVTGFDTTWKGESSICSWEIATGGWGNFYFPWLLVLGGMGIGLVFYPKSTYAAFQAGLTMSSAFTAGLSKHDMYSLSVDELRVKFQQSPSKIQPKSYLFWAVASLATWLAPFVFGVIILNLFH